MTKHTPGPWKVTKCDDGVFMCHTDGDTICFGDPNHRDPDDTANFRLIASAPDMLEALITVLKWHNIVRNVGVEALSQPVENATRAAIAKATGEPEK